MKPAGNGDAVKALLKHFYIKKKYPLTEGDAKAVLRILSEKKADPKDVAVLIDFCCLNGRMDPDSLLSLAEWKYGPAEKGGTGDCREDVTGEACRILGIKTPTKRQKDMIRSWTETKRYTREEILDACRITAETAASPSVQYADKVLSNAKAGKKTRTPVTAGQKAEEKKPQSRRKTKNAKNAFTDFEQREYDYRELEKLLVLGRQKSE